SSFVVYFSRPTAPAYEGCLAFFELLLVGSSLQASCSLLARLLLFHYSLVKVPTVGDKKPALLLATGFRTDILRTFDSFRLFSVRVASSDFAEFVSMTTRPHSVEWGKYSIP